MDNFTSNCDRKNAPLHQQESLTNVNSNSALVTFVQMDPYILQQPNQQLIAVNSSNNNNNNIQCNLNITSVNCTSNNNISMQNQFRNQQINNLNQRNRMMAPCSTLKPISTQIQPINISYQNIMEQSIIFRNSNQRQLTKNANNAVTPLIAINPTSIQQSNTNWPQSFERINQSTNHSQECCWKRFIQQQCNHPILPIMLRQQQQNQINNQPVIYDFFNPNFRQQQNTCNNNVRWPIPIVSNVTNTSTIHQRTNWIDNRTNETNQFINCQNNPVELVPLDSNTNCINGNYRTNFLNPNAVDFYPSQQQIQSTLIPDPSKMILKPMIFQHLPSFSSSNDKTVEQCQQILNESIEKSRRAENIDQQNEIEQSNFNFMSLNHFLKLASEEENELNNDLDQNDPFDIIGKDLHDPDEQDDLIENEEDQFKKQTDDIEEEECLTDETKHPIITLAPDEMFEKPIRNRCQSMSFVLTNSSQNDWLPFSSDRRRSSITLNDLEDEFSVSLPPVRSRAQTSVSCFKESLLSKRSSLKTDRYKTELCIYMQEVGKCPYGDVCCFAHGPEEMRPKAPHDYKERTQPCEAFTDDVCYRGSSRCWYLHPKPQFNLKRLKMDLEKWLKKPFCTNRLPDDWFEIDWNPKMSHMVTSFSIGFSGKHLKTTNESRITIWRNAHFNIQQNLVDFASDKKLNKYFNFQHKYRPVLQLISLALENLKCSKEANHIESFKSIDYLNEQRKHKQSLKESVIKFCYNWQFVGCNNVEKDDYLRNIFHSPFFLNDLTYHYQNDCQLLNTFNDNFNCDQQMELLFKEIFQICNYSY